MYKSTIFILILLMHASINQILADGYSVHGKIVNPNKSPLPWIHLKLINRTDTTKIFRATTSNDGNFLFTNVPKQSYLFEASEVGKKTIKINVQVTNRDIDLGSQIMTELPIEIGEVVISSRVPPAVQNGDTTEYQAAAVKINRDATAEDMLTKLPGIIVNNGTITAGGETVQRVLVDGKPFFGDDPTLSVRNLPAEVIDKIQVFDQMSDQAQFTGFDDGQSVKTINVITKRNRPKLNFGKLSGGYGEEGRYDAAGNLNFFNDTSRISILGSSNDINQQDFTTQDILGITSSNNQVRTPGSDRGSGGGGGGQRRSAGFGASGSPGSSSSLIGQQQGINTTSTFGVNGTDSLSKNLFAQASYFFNRSDNQNLQLDNRQYLIGGDSTYLLNQKSNVSSENYNQRINSRFDYKIDPSNLLTVLPIIYFQSNEVDNNLNASTIQNSGSSLTLSDISNHNSGFNLSTHVIYRHKFDYPGRTISVDIGLAASQKVTHGDLSSLSQFSNKGLGQNDTLLQKSDYLSKVHTISANMVFTEPIQVNSQLQLTYNPSFTRNTADKNTFNFDPLTNEYSIPDLQLTNSYTNDYTTQNIGAGFRWHDTELNLTTNLAYQIAELRGDNPLKPETDLDRKFFSLMPSALLLFTFPDHRSLRIYYRTSTTPPSITQLQQIVDNSNPSLLTEGNPDLEQSYSHSLLVRYNLTSTDRANSMFLLLSAVYTMHYIANETILPFRDTTLSDGTKLTPGSQLTHPVNLDGYWNIRSFFTYGLPFDLISSALNLNAGVTYTRSPGILNNVTSITNSVGPSAGFVIGSNISKDFDFTISYMGNYTFARNSIQTNANSNYYSHTASLKWIWQFWNGFVFNNQVSNAVTSGLAAGFNQNIILWNLSVAKKFLADEKAEIKFGVADLLAQNKSVSRTITSTYIDDTYNQVLPRYFILTFTYTMR
jgi:Outer membrane protein beta-barrel family/Carboxypeptidase regulatory-like domain